MSHLTEQSWYYIQNTHSHLFLHCLLQQTITYSRTISGIMGSHSWVVGPPSPHWYQCSSWSKGDFHGQVSEVWAGFGDESWAVLLLVCFVICKFGSLLRSYNSLERRFPSFGSLQLRPVFQQEDLGSLTGPTRLKSRGWLGSSMDIWFL